LEHHGGNLLAPAKPVLKDWIFLTASLVLAGGMVEQ
jgi:hypothetical protein